MDRDVVNPKATREQVFDAISSEREYQAQVIAPDANICGTIPKSVGDYLTMLSSYMNKTLDVWTNTPGNVASLHMVRKIAGIAVKCMEQHGAPFRKLSDVPSYKEVK
jgi:hypothetical protein